MNEKYFVAALGGAYGLGNKSIASLMKFFGSAKTAWSAEVADLFKSGARKNALESFINFRAKRDGAIPTSSPLDVIDKFYQIRSARYGTV